MAGISLLDLLLFPITGPFAAARLALEQVHDLVERELYDETTLRQRLLELHMSFELGAVSEAEYEAQEAVLLERLQAAAQRRLAEAEEAEET